MGNSALKSHLETSQKTGVFQLTEKGLLEVRYKRMILCLTDGHKGLRWDWSSINGSKRGVLSDILLTKQKAP